MFKVLESHTFAKSSHTPQNEYVLGKSIDPKLIGFIQSKDSILSVLESMLIFQRNILTEDNACTNLLESPFLINDIHLRGDKR